MTNSEENSDQFIDQFSSGVSVESHNTDGNSEKQTDNTPTSRKETEDTDTNSQDQDRDLDKSDSIGSEESIKNRESVLMYLPSDIRRELDIQFDELNVKHKRQHGEGLEKNRDYYPAVIQAGLTGKDLEDILDV
ncbi:hypothetical protein [Halorubrum sp. C191]|uniref:hypothetical protein n=1 Tax=Halorubrum sp. C191 TaxID=1383842 RepID=UPI0018ECDB31|nr:hypothetical protein [Halorubrum sp. C191]